MAVNNTNSTAMAPMTSFARRESVGTDTGGRMATSGLLQLQGGRGHGWGPKPAPVSRDRVISGQRHLRTTHRTVRGSLVVRRSPTASPTGGASGAGGAGHQQEGGVR